MKAIVKEKKAKGAVVYKDVPFPEINDDEVLIKIKAAGICGTDIHIYNDEFPYWPPVILGHEFSGVIEKTGKNIKRFKPGDRVTSEPQQKVCGICRYCRQGLIHLCSSKRSPGWGMDGAMAEYIKIPDGLLHLLPPNISFLEGAVIEPASTVTHALIERASIRFGDFVVIAGPGPAGLIAAQVARACGASDVVLSGISEDLSYRFKVAGQLGIKNVFNVDRQDLSEYVMNATGGYGADIFMDCSGSEAAINQAIDICAKNGKIIAFGLTGKKSVGIGWDEAITKELNIIPSMSSTYNSWIYTFGLLKAGKLDLKKIISNIMPMSEYMRAFNMIMEKKGLKFILVPDSEYQGQRTNQI
ncbi:MAG: zinc-binding dehydrogenase [Actinobacteria bacterium]|nr:zinc-binding dehydrogenase [Actinomycetota bacterium]